MVAGDSIDQLRRDARAATGFSDAAFGAGSAADIVARLIGQRLSNQLGQPFIIENRPGAGGNIGTEAAARAAPDGYTLLIVGLFNAINATLYSKLSFDFAVDILPIASVSHTPNLMEVTPSFPAKTVPEFIVYAKANPGKIRMASVGIGTSQHVFGELFMMMTGVNMIHVPYSNGGQALTDLIGGRVQVMFDTLPQSIGHIKAGELLALAVTTKTRSEILPNIPTVSEFVPGYEASGWQGIAAPKNMPVEIVGKLNTEINAVLAQPEIKARIADFGGTVVVSSPPEFGKFIADETKKWSKVIRAVNIKPE